MRARLCVEECVFACVRARDMSFQYIPRYILLLAGRTSGVVCVRIRVFVYVCFYVLFVYVYVCVRAWVRMYVRASPLFLGNSFNQAGR